MAQEEKRLLLADLCARLPYGVIVEDRNATHTLSVGNTEFTDLFSGKCNIKPYLRPMSSMTEEEKEEFQACHCIYELHPDFQPMMCNLANELNMFNWLNKHHFDYRGLIKRGLALEASEGMYT